jgi:hypothetical protein
VYDGEFKADKICGFGKMIYKKDNIIEKGYFENGKIVKYE